VTPFEVGIWQAAFAIDPSSGWANARVRRFREQVADGVEMLPVTEGNVCDHKNLINEHGGNCILCGEQLPEGSP